MSHHILQIQTMAGGGIVGPDKLLIQINFCGMYKFLEVGSTGPCIPK